MYPAIGTSLVVRPAAALDAAAVALLNDQLGYPCTTADAADRLAEVDRQSDSQAVFVACLGQEVVGWIEISVERHLQYAPFAHIGGLVVKEGNRSLGVDGLLCEQAEAWAWAKGLEAVRVAARTARTEAHRFYRDGGYDELKTSYLFEKLRPYQDLPN